VTAPDPGAGAAEREPAQRQAAGGGAGEAAAGGGAGALAAGARGGDRPAAEAALWERRLAGAGALLRGHYLLSSGRHSPAYVQCAKLLEDPREARAAGEALAAKLARHRPQSVLSPALGALLIGHETAAALGVPFRFAERAGAALALRRGFALAPGERVAVVEDAVTTGRSTLETAELARAAGAEVVAIGAIVDRSGAARPFGGVPFESLLRLDLPTWDAADCPLCRDPAAGPAVKPGSRPGAPAGA
jgi:orotate phosphoribosyltransferase